jgi:hypothetical protein
MQNQLPDFLPVGVELLLIDCLHPFGMAFQALPAVFHECVDPLLDLTLLEIVLPSGIHNRFVPFDDLQSQIRFSRGRPPLNPWIGNDLPAYNNPFL